MFEWCSKVLTNTTRLLRTCSSSRFSTRTSLLIADVEPAPVKISTSSSEAFRQRLISARDSSRNLVVRSALAVFSLCVFA